MTLYILRLFATPHKMWDACDIAGYYTNKAELISALKKHSEELGIINDYSVDDALLTYHSNFDVEKFNNYAELASIEVVKTNQWTA